MIAKMLKVPVKVTDPHLSRLNTSRRVELSDWGESQVRDSTTDMCNPTPMGLPGTISRGAQSQLRLPPTYPEVPINH